MARRNGSTIVPDAEPAAALPSTPATPKAGARERGGSPWLGRDGRATPTFESYRQLERSLSSWGVPIGLPVAPATAIGAFFDWWVHLLGSPAKQWELMHLGAEQWAHAAQGEGAGDDAVEPMPQDKRFSDPAWDPAPYRMLADAFLRQQKWWHRATTGVPGVSRHHQDMVSFAARQWLDMVAPSNFIALNPVVQRHTLEEGGMNLLRGAAHAIEDAWREAGDLPPVGAERFEIGGNIAVTPGKVVLRNRLMELIQYAPTTRTVHPEPVLIVPAWIMKYYILDLSPQNSLIKYLVDRGHTVFAISWKNPDESDRDLGMDDYDRLGVRAALHAVRTIAHGAPVHATGYCLGGTLLSIVAAALARDGDDSLKTLTLFAAQTDFTEPGELGLFIDEGQVAFLENLMSRRGYLDKKQMQATFQMLRSGDLVWSYRLYSYLLGERRSVTDLMAWNADGTRLPYRMHDEYLHGLFLHNALARGEWEVDGKAVDLADIRVPVFNVGAIQDHVAPWRSVFKLHRSTDADQTFVLTAGGHNVGIVNPPGQAKSSYRLRARHPGDRMLTPDEWLASTAPVRGSWWEAWAAWLTARSSARIAPPALGSRAAGLAPLDDAPGTYVRRR